MFSLEQLEKATRDIIYGEGKNMSLFHSHQGDYWKMSIDGKEVASDADKATCIKKALQRSGYLQKVVTKLQEAQNA